MKYMRYLFLGVLITCSSLYASQPWIEWAQQKRNWIRQHPYISLGLAGSALGAGLGYHIPYYIPVNPYISILAGAGIGAMLPLLDMYLNYRKPQEAFNSVDNQIYHEDPASHEQQQSAAMASDMPQYPAPFTPEYETLLLLQKKYHLINELWKLHDYLSSVLQEPILFTKTLKFIDTVINELIPFMNPQLNRLVNNIKTEISFQINFPYFLQRRSLLTDQIKTMLELMEPRPQY